MAEKPKPPSKFAEPVKDVPRDGKAFAVDGYRFEPLRPQDAPDAKGDGTTFDLTIHDPKLTSGTR